MQSVCLGRLVWELLKLVFPCFLPFCLNKLVCFQLWPYLPGPSIERNRFWFCEFLVICYNRDLTNDFRPQGQWTCFFRQTFRRTAWKSLKSLSKMGDIDYTTKEENREGGFHVFSFCVGFSEVLCFFFFFFLNLTLSKAVCFFPFYMGQKWVKSHAPPSGKGKNPTHPPVFPRGFLVCSMAKYVLMVFQASDWSKGLGFSEGLP